MKFIDEPQLRLGSTAKIGKLFARGPLALALAGVPSKATNHEYTVDRHGFRWRLRLWCRGVVESLWYSPGYHEVSIIGLARIYARAALYQHRRRKDVPRARVVTPGGRS